MKKVLWFSEMLDKGVMLIFGSEGPVSVPNPLWGIHAAVIVDE